MEGAVIRGVIEGFYGPPWTHDQRLDLLEFCGREGFDTWVHAPKDDPYHRERWRDPYPDDELERMAELVRQAERCGVDFVWSVGPGLSVGPDELPVLEAKREQVLSAGVKDVQLLWDDIDRDFIDARTQAEITNAFAPKVVCPMGYAGVERTPYRDTFGSVLDPGVVVYWTGPEVCSTSISRADVDAATAAFAHELLVWDNYPVNDFARDRLFLAPYRGREEAILGGCAGLVANGMLQAVPSKLALATIADWFRGDYDPLRSFERALREYGDEVREALGEPVVIERPQDLEALVDALAPGVDAATASALLEPFV